jgi:hypothetical protein
MPPPVIILSAPIIQVSHDASEQPSPGRETPKNAEQEMRTS